jgi:hypothetical protein
MVNSSRGRPTIERSLIGVCKKSILVSLLRKIPTGLHRRIAEVDVDELPADLASLTPVRVCLPTL